MIGRRATSVRSLTLSRNCPRKRERERERRLIAHLSVWDAQQRAPWSTQRHRLPPGEPLTRLLVWSARHVRPGEPTRTFCSSLHLIMSLVAATDKVVLILVVGRGQKGAHPSVARMILRHLERRKRLSDYIFFCPRRPKFTKRVPVTRTPLCGPNQNHVTRSSVLLN